MHKERSLGCCYTALRAENGVAEPVCLDSGLQEQQERLEEQVTADLLAGRA